MKASIVIMQPELAHADLERKGENGEIVPADFASAALALKFGVQALIQSLGERGALEKPEKTEGDRNKEKAQSQDKPARVEMTTTLHRRT